MEPYKDPWLSLVKYVNETAALAFSTNLVPVLPVFVNLDAHAHIDDLPEQDFLCLSGYAMHIDDKLATIYVGVGVSTYEDPDNLRHIDLMNLVLKQFLPETRVPIFVSESGSLVQVSTMVVMGNPIIDPTEHGDVRSLQIMTVRLAPVSALAA